jgi:membrane-bound inhibitor of C-type lysozyme/heat shock protein HslJ
MQPYRAMLLLAAIAAWSIHPQAQSETLSDTTWRLVRFQGGDGTVQTPANRALYTLHFQKDGTLAARVDCNRARGTWKSPAPQQLELNLGAMTRAMCLKESLHDQIVKHWPLVRSYVLKDGHLFLSLMADGGIYEFERVQAPSAAGGGQRSPVAANGPFTYTCGAERSDTLTATFYKTQPDLVVLRRGAETRVAFGVRSASGAKYQGDDVSFWEARNEATVTWAGTQLTCQRAK